MPRQSPRKRACSCGAVELLIRGLCMDCLKDSLLTAAREQGTVAPTQGPTDKEIPMTDISTIPDEEVAPAPSEAPYVDPEPTAVEDTAAALADAAATAVASGGVPEDAPVADAPTEEVKVARRARTELESRVKDITDAFVSGVVSLGDGEALTPHRIAKRLEADAADDAKVSTGAVASVLTRWSEYGFANLNEKPLAFVDYTEAGREQGLTALKEAAATAKREQRKAIKAAEAPAAEPTAGDGGSAPEAS